MRHIALEEAFSVPEWNAEPDWRDFPIDRDLVTSWARRLRDVTEYRLPEMDEYGIDIQVLSLTVPGIQVDQDTSTARDNARFANDYLAQVIDRHPDRFRGFAALPLQDPKAAVEELERAVHELGFCGALVNDHLGGHALRVVFGGVFDRHPRATLILGHMGEFLPFMRSRLDSRYRTFRLEHPLQHSPSHYIGTNIVITTSGVFSPATLTGAILEVGADSIMFSIDYPYETTHDAVAGLAATPLSDADRARIAHQNAERILGIGG